MPSDAKRLFSMLLRRERRPSAVIYSIVETAKANHLNVYQYLYMVLVYMPDYSE